METIAIIVLQIFISIYPFWALKRQYRINSLQSIQSIHNDLCL